MGNVVAMAQNSALLKIKALAPSFSDKEQKIAELITGEPRRAARMTISEISAELGVADSTVFKFTRKLGYKGFRDFRNDLLAEDSDPQRAIHENILPEDDALTVAKKIVNSSVSSLNATLTLLDGDMLERAVGSLTAANRVCFYGVGLSGVIALDAFQKFLRAPLPAECVSDTHMQVMHASKLGKGDVAIVFTHTGRSKEMYAVAQLAKGAGATVILVTSYPSQEISKFADIVFVSSSEETGYRPESLACRYAQMAIVDTLYTAIMFRMEGSTSSVKKIRHAISLIKDTDEE